MVWVRFGWGELPALRSPFFVATLVRECHPGVTQPPVLIPLSFASEERRAHTHRAPNSQASFSPHPDFAGLI